MLLQIHLNFLYRHTLHLQLCSSTVRPCNANYTQIAGRLSDVLEVLEATPHTLPHKTPGFALRELMRFAGLLPLYFGSGP